MIDFHSHILPGIDDGSKSPEMSMEIIKTGQNEGVDKFIFTPHFYDHRQSYEDFIISRKKSIIELKNYYEEQNEAIPDFLLGAEVSLSENTPFMDNLEKLCIEGTELLLLEIPYTPYVHWAPKAIYSIMYERGVTPVIAHLDRYIENHGHKKVIEEIIRMDIPIQINTSAFLDRKARKFVKKLLENDSTVVIGSDVHNLSTRPYEISKARELANKKFKYPVFEKLASQSEYLLEIYKKWVGTNSNSFLY